MDSLNPSTNQTPKNPNINDILCIEMFITGNIIIKRKMESYLSNQSFVPAYVVHNTSKRQNEKKKDTWQADSDSGYEYDSDSDGHHRKNNDNDDTQHDQMGQASMQTVENKEHNNNTNHNSNNSQLWDSENENDNEDEKEEGAESVPMSIPIFQHDWGQPSTNDAWCFLCTVDEDKSRLIRNRHFRKLLELLTLADSMSEYQQCCNIQTFYNKHFKRHHHDWTLLSIRSHLDEHLGSSNKKMIQEVIRITYAQIKLLSDGNLRMVDPQTGQKFINIKATNSFLNLSKNLISLMKELER
jgi:hypothetical protein